MTAVCPIRFPLSDRDIYFLAGARYSKKMMSSFADGVYYDNQFLMASYQPMSALGPGYVDVDTGLLKAGVSLWAWREFAKRSAVLQAELGKRHTVLMIHMTSVNLLPVMGWASVNFDWEELEDGAIRNSDFQTRFQLGCDATGEHCTDTNMVLAQSAGLQSGTIPFVVGEGCTPIGKCVSRSDLSAIDCGRWIRKTHYAMALVHEVRPSCYQCGPQGGCWGADTPSGCQNLSSCTIPGSPDGAHKPTPAVFNVTSTMIGYGYSDP